MVYNSINNPMYWYPPMTIQAMAIHYTPDHWRHTWLRAPPTETLQRRTVFDGTSVFNKTKHTRSHGSFPCTQIWYNTFSPFARMYSIPERFLRNWVVLGQLTQTEKLQNKNNWNNKTSREKQKHKKQKYWMCCESFSLLFILRDTKANRERRRHDTVLFLIEKLRKKL